jgi:hypothetical protein
MSLCLTCHELLRGVTDGCVSVGGNDIASRSLRQNPTTTSRETAKSRISQCHHVLGTNTRRRLFQSLHQNRCDTMSETVRVPVGKMLSSVLLGNVLMLSQGRPGVDDTFSLDEGICIEVEFSWIRWLRFRYQAFSDSPSTRRCMNERAWLENRQARLEAGELKQDGVGGWLLFIPFDILPSTCPRLIRSLRTVIEIDLRLPSMLHGKKGFERIIWACNNVFTQSITWLFCDLRQAKGTMPANPSIQDCGKSHLLRRVTTSKTCSESMLNLSCFYRGKGANRPAQTISTGLCTTDPPYSLDISSRNVSCKRRRCRRL